MTLPSTPSTSIAHLVFLALPAWGHVRPLLTLATRLVLERENVSVTVLLAPNVIEKAYSDMINQFRSSLANSAVKQRIRIVSIFTSNGSAFDQVQPLADSYPAVYENLLQSKPLVCASTGTTFEALPPPSVIIMDFFCLPQLQVTHARTGHSIPVIAFVSAGAAHIIEAFGPENIGGRGDLGAKIEAEAKRTGRSLLEVGEEMHKHTDGSIIRIPGLPPMYDYELFPQDFDFGSPMSLVVRGGYAFFQDCDGAIIQTNSAYDNTGSLTALKSWLNGDHKQAYTIGPLLPLGYGTEDFGSRGDSDVERFMNQILEKYGKNSLIFISFGTIFWPSNSEYLQEVVEALIERKNPFLLCHASPLARLSEELIAKVQGSGLGYVSKWAPQQYILNHPATGWFLTHCGQNGVTESLGSGIPLICWPFQADQPGNAAHLSENLRVAIELIEVRTGTNGMRPMLRNGRAPAGTRKAVGIEIRRVLDDTKGARGQELRRNAEKLKEAFGDSWKEGGEAKTELGAFLDRYI